MSTLAPDKKMHFDWSIDRAISVKALIEGRGVSDKQIGELKERLADLVRDVIGGHYATVQATVAERGTRTWAANGDKIKIEPAE